MYQFIIYESLHSNKGRFQFIRVWEIHVCLFLTKPTLYKDVARYSGACMDGGLKVVLLYVCSNSVNLETVDAVCTFV